MPILDMKPLAKIIDIYHTLMMLNGQITDNLPKELGTGDLQIIKDAATGQYKWLAVYTNSFRDEDAVPEIISSKSQKAFVENVDAGNYSYPELQLWHNPKWRFGEATVVAFDEVEPGIGFAVAGGTIDIGKEYVAEALVESGVAWKNSHGMPTGGIIRDFSDKTVYDKHITTEITVLPAEYAANPLTGFGLLGEKGMIPNTKKAEIMGKLGIGKEVLTRLEESNIAVASAEKDTREYKEKSSMSEQAEEANVQAGAAEAAAVTEQATEEVVEQVREAPATPALDVDALLGANKEVATEVHEIKEALEVVIGALEVIGVAQKNMTERIGAMEKAKEDEVVAQTPTYSQAFKARIDSVVGNPVAKVSKEKDAEAAPTGPAQEKAAPRTQFGSSFLAGLVDKSVGS